MSLVDIILPKWCQIFLSSVQLVSSSPWGYAEDQMGKCWAASQGPSLHCPFWSPTFWSWHGASGSLCPSAVLPVVVPKTDFTFQPWIPAPDVWMLFSVQLICQHPKNVAEQKLSENISQHWLQEFFISGHCFVLVFLPRTDLIELPPIQNFGASSTDRGTVVKCPQNVPWTLCVRDFFFAFPNQSNWNAVTSHPVSSHTLPVLLSLPCALLGRSGKKDVKGECMDIWPTEESEGRNMKKLGYSKVIFWLPGLNM